MGGRIFSFYKPIAIISGMFPYNLSNMIQPSAIPIIGRHRNLPQYGFIGTIDDVRVYNRALTDEEILLQSEHPAKNGLLAYYPLDEAKGETAFDASGNNNHATVKDGAAWTDGKINKALRFIAGENDRLQPPSVPLQGDGWSISLWYNGAGTPFGWGYTYYSQGAQGMNFHTTEGVWNFSFGYGAASDVGFWNHMTISMDNTTKRIKVLVRNEEQCQWYQQNIKWTYIQARGFNPPPDWNYVLVCEWTGKYYYFWL